MFSPSLSIALVALASLLPVLGGKVIITAGPNVILPGQDGSGKWEFQIQADGTPRLGGLALNPYWRTEVFKTDLKGNTVFEKYIEHRPNCRFEGKLKLTDHADIIFHFRASSDFLYPCGDQNRGLRIVCDLDGKPADCLGVAP